MADYNINAVTRKVVYTGSAGLGPYSFSFEVLISTDVAVYFNTTLLTLSTDYSVTVNANGTGSVTIITGTNVPTTPDADDAITIVGARDIERTTDFSTGGDFQAVAINEQLDANIIFIQQIDERVDRSIKAAVTDPTSINMELPIIATRANKVMAFDSSGNVSVSTNTLSAIEDGATDAAASAAAALISANAAAADLALTNADVVSTAADAVSTAADVTSLTGVTSTTSLAITVASKAFTVASGLSLQAGDWVICTSDANPSVNYMHGPISSYSGTTLIVNVDNIGGSGTLADWTIRRSGTQGATGATGATGPTGPAVGNLNDIGDVTLTTPSNGQALTYNGSIWVNGSGGGGLFKGDNGETGSSAGDIFRCNKAELNTNVTITSAENASATGPVGVASGVTLTVEGVLVII